MKRFKVLTTDNTSHAPYVEAGMTVEEASDLFGLVTDDNRLTGRDDWMAVRVPGMTEYFTIPETDVVEIKETR